MSNLNSRKNLFKDAAILLSIASLLILLPWLQSYFEDDSQEMSTTSFELDDGVLTQTPSVQQNKLFINRVFPVLSSWQMIQLAPYLDEATKTGNWSGEIASVLNTLSGRLGALKDFGEPRPVAIDAAILGEHEEDLAHYEFVAFYESGAADVQLTISENSGESQLYAFSINVHDES